MTKKKKELHVSKAPDDDENDDEEEDDDEEGDDEVEEDDDVDDQARAAPSMPARRRILRSSMPGGTVTFAAVRWWLWILGPVVMAACFAAGTFLGREVEIRCERDERGKGECEVIAVGLLYPIVEEHVPIDTIEGFSLNVSVSHSSKGGRQTSAAIIIARPGMLEDLSIDDYNFFASVDEKETAVEALNDWLQDEDADSVEIAFGTHFSGIIAGITLCGFVGVALLAWGLRRLKVFVDAESVRLRADLYNGGFLSEVTWHPLGEYADVEVDLAKRALVVKGQSGKRSVLPSIGGGRRTLEKRAAILRAFLVKLKSV